MSIATDVLTCPVCAHPWLEHLPASFNEGCLHPRCRCDNPRRSVTAAERIAAIRAEKGESPLASTVDDKRTILVGHHVTEARDGDDLRAGIVVERWHTEDGEPGVTFASFRHRGQHVAVRSHRLLVSELRQEVLPRPDRSYCALAQRKLARVLAQGIRSNDTAEEFSDAERRYLNWIFALENASTPA